jgi:tetratricopeptide (TPR) repeat protein
MRKRLWVAIPLTIASLVAILILFYFVPPINQRLSWRVDFALTYVRSLVNPAGEVPTPLPQPAVAVTQHPTPIQQQLIAATVAVTPTQGPTATLEPSPTPIPESAQLPAPQWEKQDINNCGPASLAMYLRFYGWEGDQFDIANLLKPKREDRNVNVEELTYYARTRAGWLTTEFRVGGDINILKSLVAAGFPVMIEEGTHVQSNYWPDDDNWAGHYLLITGYNDNTQIFTAQDSFRKPDMTVSYDEVDKNWQAYNRVYILVFPPAQEDTIMDILGEHWDIDANRQHALEVAKAETVNDPENAYTWFNLGSNLVYFERYQEAARAYDQARTLGLPQRMLRYQFGPFFAYFFSGRNDDLLALTDYALQRTPNAEEALLWHGWAMYREGKIGQAISDFYQALEENPNFEDARYALDFVKENQ